MKLKETKEVIPFSQITTISMDIAVKEFHHFQPVVYHSYDKDPTGSFYDKWTYLDVHIQTMSKTYHYHIDAIRKTLPVFQRITKDENIKLTIQPIEEANDIVQGIEPAILYEKHVRPTLSFEPFIRNWE